LGRVADTRLEHEQRLDGESGERGVAVPADVHEVAGESAGPTPEGGHQARALRWEWVPSAMSITLHRCSATAGTVCAVPGQPASTGTPSLPEPNPCSTLISHAPAAVTRRCRPGC